MNNTFRGIYGFFGEFKEMLETIDRSRDRLLFVFIRPYWPRSITPNHLSVFRICIGIILFFLLFNYKYDHGVLVISLFSIGAFTDLLDGSIARCLHKETKAGSMIDPVADRILILPIAIYSLIGKHAELLYLLLFLEVINSALFLYSYKNSILTTSNIFGKTKMVFQSVVFAAILLFWPRTPGMFFIYLLWISSFLLIMSIISKAIDIEKNIKNALDNEG